LPRSPAWDPMDEWSTQVVPAEFTVKTLERDGWRRLLMCPCSGQRALHFVAQVLCQERSLAQNLEQLCQKLVCRALLGILDHGCVAAIINQTLELRGPSLTRFLPTSLQLLLLRRWGTAAYVAADVERCRLRCVVKQCFAACPGNVRCVEHSELGHAAIGLKEGGKGCFKHSEAGVVGGRVYNIGAAPVAQRRGLRGIQLRNEPLAEPGHVLHGHGADVASASVLFVVIPVVWQQVAHNGRLAAQTSYATVKGAAKPRPAKSASSKGSESMASGSNKQQGLRMGRIMQQVRRLS